jgi:hypothetical protein
MLSVGLAIGVRLCFFYYPCLDWGQSWLMELFGIDAAIAAPGQTSSSAIASARFRSRTRLPARLPT